MQVTNPIVNEQPMSLTLRGDSPKARRQIAVAAMIVAMLLTLIATARLPAETIKLGGTGGSLATMQRLAEAFKKESPTDEVRIVKGLGGKGSVKALSASAVDIAVTSTAGNGAPEATGFAVKKFAKVPLIFVAHAQAPGGNVNLNDIVEIYGGRRTVWPSGERLRLIVRNESDSDTEVLKSMSAAVAEAVNSSLKREGLSIAANDHEGADLIERTPGAFGTNMLSLVSAEKRALKVLSFAGAAPSAKALANGSYPWFKTYYVATKPAPSQSVERFVSFIFSAKGRQIAAPHEYWQATRDAR